MRNRLPPDDDAVPATSPEPTDSPAAAKILRDLRSWPRAFPPAAALRDALFARVGDIATRLEIDDSTDSCDALIAELRAVVARWRAEHADEFPRQEKATPFYDRPEFHQQFALLQVFDELTVAHLDAIDFELSAQAHREACFPNGYDEALLAKG